MSDTLPIVLNSAPLGIGRHVSGIADPINGHIDAFRMHGLPHSAALTLPANSILIFTRDPGD